MAQPDIRTLGLIAGGGGLPRILAASARERGMRVVTVALEGFADDGLGELSDACAVIHPGQVREVLCFLKEKNVDAAVLCGGLDHRIVFTPDKFDDLAFSLLAGGDNRAEALLGRVVSVFEQHELRIAALRDLLADHLAPEGQLGSVKPGKAALADLSFAWPLAQRLAELNIGQSMMVKDGVVIAVEAVEGTDEMIRRTAKLQPGGGVVIKLPLQRKDPRFDMPVIGSETIRSMAEAGASLLAVAAGQTIIIDPEPFRALADEAGVAILAQSADWEPL